MLTGPSGKEDHGQSHSLHEHEWHPFAGGKLDVVLNHVNHPEEILLGKWECLSVFVLDQRILSITQLPPPPCPLRFFILFFFITVMAEVLELLKVNHQLIVAGVRNRIQR